MGDLTAINRTGTANDWTYAFSSWSQLKTAVRAGSTTVTYALDALDRVLSRTSGAQTATLTYQGLGETLARAVVGSATTNYASTPGGPLAQRRGANTRYYLRDQHGDLVGWANTSAALAGTALYDPWGQLLSATGEMGGNPPAQGVFRFQSQLTDASTGQVDMLTRLYEPTLGRFSSRDMLFGDPIDPITLNQLAYGGASPVTNSDPTGMYLVGDGGGGCDSECAENVESGTWTLVPSHAFASPALKPVFDPAYYRTWIEQYREQIDAASSAFDVPASVIAATLATEHQWDRRSNPKAFGEWFASKLCGAPGMGGIARCDRVSFGAGQVEIRRGELVDTAVREAVVDLCESFACEVLVRLSWSRDRGDLIGRLRDEELNIMYVGAYLDRLRGAAPPGSSWATIYGTVFNPQLGSYNSDPKFVAGFANATGYYSYLGAT